MHTHLITVVFRGSKCVSAFTQLPVEVEECVALGRETMTFANTHIHTQTTDIELGILLYVTYDILPPCKNRVDLETTAYCKSRVLRQLLFADTPAQLRLTPAE